LFSWVLPVLGLRVPGDLGNAVIRFIACGPFAVIIGVQLTLGMLSGFVFLWLWRASGFRRYVPASKFVIVAAVIGIVFFAVSLAGAVGLRAMFHAVCA
jgi:lipopolysaccharide export LptBFGC system permease protein LptF